MSIKFIEKSEKKRLLENIVSLGLLQGVNYVIPILTIPYLVRILGPDYFGLLAFSTATIMYFVLLSDYGFNLSATRQISIHRENPQKINEIFSSVMIIKISLMLFGFFLLILLTSLVQKFNEHWEVYVMTFGLVIGNVLFPVWFFQGMEKMKYITYINIFSKSVFTLLIFIFVNTKSDFILVPLFTALGGIFGGLWSLYVIIKKMGYKFICPTLSDIKFQLSDGWHVFLSSMAISLYTISNTFILGLLTNNTTVGQFAAIEKILQAVKGLYQPISQAVYPLIGKKFKHDRMAALGFIKQFSKIVILLMTLVSVFLYIFADSIVDLILGSQFANAATLLKIMSPLPLVIAISNILGILTMLNLGLKSAFSGILILAAILGIILSITLVPSLQEHGTAYTLLVVELFVMLSMFFYLRNYINSKFFNRNSP